MPSRVGRFTSTSIREPFWVASTRSSSTASRVGPRFSISTRTCDPSVARTSIAPSNVDRCRSGGAVDREPLLVADDLPLGIDADNDAAGQGRAGQTGDGDDPGTKHGPHTVLRRCGAGSCSGELFRARNRRASSDAADVAPHLPALERQGRRPVARNSWRSVSASSSQSRRSSGETKTITPGPFSRREHRVVFVVAILGDERPRQLAGHPVVLDIPGPAQFFVLEHEKDVPAEARPHEVHHAVGDVRVGVDAGGCSRATCGASSEASVPIRPVYRPPVGPRMRRSVSVRCLIGAGRFRRARSSMGFGSSRPRAPAAADPRPAPRACGPALRRAPAVCRSDGILAEQRERDRRIAIGDDRVRQHAGIDLPPAHRFRRRRSGQAAPDHLIGRDLDEVVVAALRNAVDLPQASAVPAGRSSSASRRRGSRSRSACPRG